MAYRKLKIERSEKPEANGPPTLERKVSARASILLCKFFIILFKLILNHFFNILFVFLNLL